MIRLSPVHLGPEEERLAVEVLRSGQLAQGPMVDRFENAFRDIAGTQHAVAMNSGTAALVAALEALGIGTGDEVVTSPFTFVATLNAILEVGATARFAEIDEEDLNIDPEAAREAISPRTAALLPVHLYGYPANMGRIASLASAKGLAIVEDAAQAAGASVRGRPVGGFGLGCFSFYATKNVTTGEGGMVTTDDSALADRLRLLRNQGMSERYWYELRGHNYRMPEFMAALGIPQLTHLEERNELRRRNAKRLSDLLAGLPGIILPRPESHRIHVFHQYTIRVLEGGAIDRDTLAEGLRNRGIETGVYYPRAVYDYPFYMSHPLVRIEPMPKTEAASRQVLSLPVHPWLSATELEWIAESVRMYADGGG